MVQRDEPSDYVLSTGECHSVKEFVEEVRTEEACFVLPHLLLINCFDIFAQTDFCLVFYSLLVICFDIFAQTD